MPLILENALGDGTVTYCGVWPGEEIADALVVDLLDRAEVPHTERFPETVRVTARDEYVWILNFGADPVDIDVDSDAVWHVGGSSIPGFGVGIVEAGLPDVTIR